MIRRLVSCSALVSLAACQTSTPALESSLSEGFGDAVRQNIEVHAIAPTPASKADTYIPADASVQQRARQAYRDGEVEEPRQLRTGGE